MLENSRHAAFRLTLLAFAFASAFWFLWRSTRLAPKELGEHLICYGIVQEIGNLKPNAEIRVGGVSIGYVQRIELDPIHFTPKLTLAIQKAYAALPSSSQITVRSAGLLGDSYLCLSPVYEEDSAAELKGGETLLESVPSFSLERLLLQFLN